MGIYANKHIASAFLAMVTLIMLLVAMLPHHHHREEVCFTDRHCAGDRDHLDADACNAGEHEHDLPGKESDCLVLHVFLLPDIKVLSGNSKDNGDHALQQGIFTCNLLEPGGPGLSVPRPFKPPVAGLHCPEIGGAVSLRGPPSIA